MTLCHCSSPECLRQACLQPGFRCQVAAVQQEIDAAIVRRTLCGPVVNGVQQLRISPDADVLAQAILHPMEAHDPDHLDLMLTVARYRLRESAGSQPPDK